MNRQELNKDMAPNFTNYNDERVLSWVEDGGHWYAKLECGHSIYIQRHVALRQPTNVRCYMCHGRK